MARPSKEYQARDLTDRLLAVPRATVEKRIAEHREQAAKNPRKRGPKPKACSQAARFRHGVIGRSHLCWRDAVQCSDEILIGQALADDARNGERETLRIRQLALIEPKRLFVQIPEQVERFNANVPLSARFSRTRSSPARSCGPAIHVRLGVVDHVVDVAAMPHAVVGAAARRCRWSNRLRRAQ